MKTEYTGIDYSLGQSNTDHKKGIRYGVINQNAVGQAWFDDSEPYYRFYCPECTTDFEEDMHDICPVCSYHVRDSDYDIFEPLSYFYSDSEYQAECDTDYGDIFITKSPYFTYAQFCSPCAPGAVHLENPLTVPNENNKGYCFGHDWFEGGKAPYPVYSVKTGKLVD